MFAGAITLTAVRRPEVLEATLNSFRAALDPGWPVGQVLVNLDPAMGDASAHTATREVVFGHFPDAEIFEPSEPGFGAAVIRLWARVPDGPVLHLEDDWTCLDRIDLALARDRLTRKVPMVSFLNPHHGRKGERRYSEASVKSPRLWGLIRSSIRVSRFNTGPALADGAFLRACAALMDPTLDPEKQMRRLLNPRLNDWLDRHRCRFLKAPGGGPLLSDEGRAWRDARGIRKDVTGGAVTWTTP